MCACKYIREGMVLHPEEEEEALWVERAAQPHYSNLREHMFGDACNTGFKVNSRRGGRGCIRWVRLHKLGIKLQLGQLQKEG